MEAIALIVALSVAGSSAVGHYRRAKSPAPVVEQAAPVAELSSYERPRPMPNTAPIGEDARSMRSIDAWTLHPGYEVSPRGVVAAFLLAERGRPETQVRLVNDLIEGDCSLRNLFEQREQAVAGKDWVMQGDGGHEASSLAAVVLGTALKRLPVIEVFQHLLTANRHGYSGCEMDWGVLELEGRRWIVPTWFTNVEPERFRISPENQLRLYTDASRPEGDELRPGKWITLQRPGRLSRAGLMRTAVWPAIGKRLGWRDWLVYSQRFGIPLVLAHYDEADSDDDILEVAEKIVKMIGTDAGAVIPKSIKVDIVEAVKGTPNDKTHGGLISHCNAEMAKLIVGATLTNDNAGSGGASYALGEVHAAVRWDNVTFDAAKLQEAIRTQICVPFMRFNNLTGPAPLIEIQVVRDLSPQAIIQMANVLTNEMGVEVSASQLRQIAALRKPAPGDAAPGKPKAEPAAAPMKEAA